MLTIETFETFLKWIEANNRKIDSDIIKSLIQANKKNAYKMGLAYKRYLGDELPIQYRVFNDSTKINNKIANDYRGLIVDQAIGFLFGKPITYQLDKLKYGNNKEIFENDYTYFTDFLRRNSFDLLDIETAKRSSICGTSGRLCYIDKQGKERVMNVNPWEVIFIYDGAIDELQYAVRYYPITEIINGRRKVKTKVEWYDSKNITYYIQDDNNNYVLDDSVEINPQPHFFNKVPLIEFPNNDERQGDFVKVEELIDAYDRTISDAQNEIEEFRQAYQVFKGAEIDEKTRNAARQTGAFSLPAGAEVSYLTKQINDTFLQNHKKTLEDNIYKFSKTINMESETFTGLGSSGEARKWAMTGLEFRVSVKQMKFAQSLYKMFDVLSSAWAAKGLSLSPDKILFSFDRNYPQELKLEAEIMEKLAGHISKRTQLEIFSPVRDVDAELKRIEEERAAMIDLDKIKFEDEEKEEE